LTFGVILAMATVTYATRFVGLAIVRGDVGRGAFARWLRYVPVGIFAAIIVPGALAPHGRIELGPNALAALVALVVAFRTRQVLLTLAAGMASYWLLRAVGL
jgi:branched-subunit amino acid transport protein